MEVFHAAVKMVNDLTLEVEDSVLDLIAEAGFDPVFGARPLKRVIKSRIERALAKEILAGHCKPGDTVNVSCQGDNVEFQIIAQADVVDDV